MFDQRSNYIHTISEQCSLNTNFHESGDYVLEAILFYNDLQSKDAVQTVHCIIKK